MTPIELIELDDLILSLENPRTISKDEMDRLCKSMRDDPDFMRARPILVNKDEEKRLVVYAGNQRVRAAKILGWEKIPCIIESGISQETIKERLIKDNMHSGEWDYDSLSSNFELEMLLDLGFTPQDLDIGLDIIENKEKEGKKDCKMCPKCGHEF